MTEVPSSVLHKSRVRSMVPDIFLVYGLAVSIFMPFYFTVAAVLLVTAMVIFNKERRHRVLKTAADRRLIALLVYSFLHSGLSRESQRHDVCSSHDHGSCVRVLSEKCYDTFFV